MTTENLRTTTLLVSILGIAIAACSDPEDDKKDTSDAMGGGNASGGATLGELGGAPPGGLPGVGGGPASGGTIGAGGLPGNGGVLIGQGGSGMGGSGTGGSGTGGSGIGGSGIGGSGIGGSGIGGVESGGMGPGGAENGGMATGGSELAGSAGDGLGGSPGVGGGVAGDATSGGAENGGEASGGEPPGGAIDPGNCTPSQENGTRVSGTGPHEVVIETNPEDGIACGTIYRPADLDGDEKFPILVWGEGGCEQNGFSNQAAMGEIASFGYFIVADGTPNGQGACAGGQDGRAFLDYITWAIAQNEKPCSPYYQRLETTKIAADGFSCGGLMSENVSGDPRFAAIGITSSGLFNADAGIYDAIHTPFKIMNGGSNDMAYENGLRDYEEISTRDVPIVYFSKSSAGHGGDLGNPQGDFNRVNLAWLNWQLKGDEGETGKGFLVGANCQFCNDSGWDFRSANLE